MPTLYIHLGMPKTGTSSLQHFFYNNRELLFRKNNIFYPQPSLPDAQHYALLDDLNQEAWKNLREELPQGTYDVLLSSELAYFSFFKRTLEECQIIKDTFPGYDIKFIIYVRRFDDFLNSLYLQFFSEQAISLPFPCWLDKQLQSLESPIASPGEQFARLQNTWGAECPLILRCYAKEKLKNGNVIDDFLECLGRDKPQDAIEILANPSVPKKLLRYLSKDILPVQGGIADPIFWDIRESMVNTLAKFEGEEIKPHFYEKIEKENARLAELVPGYHELYANREAKLSVAGLDAPSQEDVFLHALLYKILIRQRNHEETLKRIEEQVTHVLSVVLKPYSFPTKTQRFFLKLFKPGFRLLLPAEEYRYYKKDPAGFFSTVKGRYARIVKAVLRVTGPNPNKGKNQ